MGSPFNTVLPNFNPTEVGQPSLVDDAAEMAPAPQAGTGGSSGMFQIIGNGGGGIFNPEPGPAVRIGPKDMVFISPMATNTGNVYYSTVCASAAKFGPRLTVLAPGPSGQSVFPRLVKVRNLNEIFVTSDSTTEGIL